MTHKAWLDNEYSEWVKALKESTVDNFKEHPVVKRMLSIGLLGIAPFNLQKIPLDTFSLLCNISSIGTAGNDKIYSSDFRMIYYAEKVLKQNPKRIIEIGSGWHRM